MNTKRLCPGIVPRVVKVAPACAIMISSYEFGKAFFRRHNTSVDATATVNQWLQRVLKHLTAL